MVGSRCWTVPPTGSPHLRARWLRTFALRDDAERDCVGDRCTQAGLDRYDDARASATLSTIAIPLGVVLMAAGAYFVLVRPSGDGSSVALSPTGAYGTW